MNFKSYDWRGIEIRDSIYSIRIGHSCIEGRQQPVPDQVLPNHFEGMGYCPVDPTFIKTLSDLLQFIPHDSRKGNLDGLFVGEDAIYACDNYRAVRTRGTPPRLLIGVFIPAFAVEAARRCGKVIDEVGISDSHIVFRSKGVCAFANLRGQKFPPIKLVFDRAEAARTTAVETEDAEPKTDLKEFFAAATSPTVEVILAGNKMQLVSYEEGGGRMELEFPVKVDSDQTIKFQCEAKYFVEALLTCAKFEIGEGWLLFRREDIPTTYLIAQHRKDGYPLVFFENQEILGPNELRQRYGVSIKRTETSNKPYAFDEVRELLKTGGAKLLRGTSRLEGIVVSIGEGEKTRT